MSKIPVALQLWSLRDDAPKDFIGTLKAIAKMGYQGVEFAGYHGLPASELRKVLDDLGLKVAGSHVGWGELESNLNGAIDYALALGNPHIVCPGNPGDRTQDAAGWVWFANAMSEVAEKAGSHGLKVGYHNHSHEFHMYDGKYALDIFFANADGVVAELDLGWVLNAGVDPISYMRKYTGRCPLVHIKDFRAEGGQTEIGTGTLPLAGIVAAAPEVGVKWHIIEIEEYNMAPIESVRVSVENLLAALG